MMKTAFLCSSLLLTFATSTLAAEEASFRREVMAVLSHHGCNAGACHGNLNGKGGFKLSLRGEDADWDFKTLTRDTHARRIDLLAPTESLLLRKATGVVPHEGGPRFGIGSSEYEILRRWITVGCPDDRGIAPLAKLEVTPRQKVLIEPAGEVKLTVRGTFADGSTRDLAGLAVYEPTVVGIVSVAPDGTVKKLRDGELVLLVRYLDRQTAVQLAFIPPREKFIWTDPPAVNEIDRILYAQFRELRLTPSPLAEDSVFLRRIYLDLLGVLPTVAEARAFLMDSRPLKRDLLMDALLERPEFADFWAQKWGDLLRNEEKTLDAKGVRIFQRWLRDSIASGKPLNELAREVIAGRGSTYQNPPANFYRAIREPYARAESAAQVFLGVRIQCAKCHNHPFDQWKQDDYHTFAALFAKVGYRVLENRRGDNLDSHEFTGDQIVYVDRAGILKHPRTNEPLQPRFLGSQTAVTSDDPLQALADWIADAKNPYFAKAQANRIWYHLLGRGLIEPIDDFRATNPPVNGPLLDYLAKELAGHRFDLRHLVKLIVRSRVYQLAALPAETNSEDETHFSRALVQPLEAEQLLDALGQVFEQPVSFRGYPAGTRAGQLAAPSGNKRVDAGSRFLKVFGKPDRLLTCECERTEDPGLLQAFQMLNGDILQRMLSASDNRLGKLIAKDQKDEAIIEELYLAALSRPPSERERSGFIKMLSSASNRRAASRI